VSDKILAISLGHLNSFDAGLGEFARRLGDGLAARADAWRSLGIQLCFHMERRLHGAFGDAVTYLAYRPRDRFVPWRLPGCVLWHSTFQHNITRPPAGVPHRLLTVHDLNYRYARLRLGPLRDRALTRIAIARSTSLATISRYVADDVTRNVPWRGPLRTIYNGVTDLSAAPRRPVPDLAGRRFFLHISRMARSKNVGAILDLARTWPERTFVLVGPAWGHSKRLHDELPGTLPNVRVLLGVDDSVKAWLFANCEAFLFPSLTEGFGLPPLEAMHFGTPVFLSDRTSLPEIGGTQAGYFGDFSAAAMRQVIDAELPRLQATREATRRHAGTFTWDRCVADYVDLYAGALPAELGTPRVDSDRALGNFTAT
jgi:glycosyltransferase involved in cell wall biosynthesis